MPIYLNNAKVEQVRTGVTPSPAVSPPSPPTADGAVGASTDYARADHQHPSELPSGGSTGQVLTKTASGEEWADAPSDTSLAETVTALQKNLGTAGHNCRVAFGSYVGDGNVGKAAPTTLASPFYPVLVLVQRVISGNNSIANPSVFVRPNDKGTNAADKSTMDSLLYLTWADDSVSWYSYNTGGAYAQLNTYGTTYLYIILGYDKATEDAE